MIESNSLTKRYDGHTVVRDVSFRCEPGTVTGFLGPNGAGKSTTLKMLCGMAQPSSGRASVLGVPFAELPNPGRRVGVLIDASAQHSGRRGAEVAGDLGAADGRRPRAASTRCSSSSDSTHAAARKRVGKYSLGMRQRLGIAHALLGDPEVLILDEPANGLDPEGMRWMRGLLQGLRRSRRHRAALVAPAARGAGHRRSAGGHRPRPDRRPGHAERAAGRRPRTIVRAAGDGIADRAVALGARRGVDLGQRRRRRRTADRRRARGGRPRRPARQRRAGRTAGGHRCVQPRAPVLPAHQRCCAPVR